MIWASTVNSTNLAPTMLINLVLTGLIFLAALALIVGMVIIEKRPRSDLNPRLIPTTPVLIISGFVALLALIHLVNLVGLHTGRFH